MCLFANDSRNCLFASALSCSISEFRSIYHLQFVLPEFLLARLIQKGEIPDMVDKHIPQDRQVRVLRRELTSIGAEWGAETL